MSDDNYFVMPVDGEITAEDYASGEEQKVPILIEEPDPKVAARFNNYINQAVDKDGNMINCGESYEADYYG